MILVMSFGGTVHTSACHAMKKSKPYRTFTLEEVDVEGFLAAQKFDRCKSCLKVETPLTPETKSESSESPA